MQRQPFGRTASRFVSVLVASVVLGSGLGLTPAAPSVAAELPLPLPGPSAALPLASGPLDPAGLELVSRTETTNVFRLADGRGALYSYAGPVNWRAADGSWVPFDTTVIADGLGRFRNRSGPVTVSFAGVTGLGPLMRVRTDTWSVAFSPIGMLPGVAGLPDGRSIRYQDVMGSNDVDYDVGPSHVKEVVTVPNSAAAGSGVFRFQLELSGVTAHEGGDGTIGFYDTAGARVAWIPPGVAFDSSGDAATGRLARSAPVAVHLGNDPDGRPVVEVHAPRDFLDDPTTVWPVKVDPAVNFGGGPYDFDSYVRSNCGTCNQHGTNPESAGGQFSAGYYIAPAGYVGCPTSCVEYDSYFLYNLDSALGQTILSATWNAYTDLSGTNPNSHYTLWPVADPYDINTVTFNTRPNHYVSGTCDGNMSKCGNPPTGGPWVSQDVRTWVTNWTRTPVPTWNNRGIIADSAGDTSATFWFDANEGPHPSYLYVVYNLPPTASSLAPNGGYQTTATPQLCATWNDANQNDHNQSDTGYVAFSLYNSGGTLVWSGNSGTLSDGGRGCVTTPALARRRTTDGSGARPRGPTSRSTPSRRA